MRKHTVLRSGRPRTTREELFTEALMTELDRERECWSYDQRAFAAHLGVHESLLSMYRSGQRLPSIVGFIELEKRIPDLLLKVVKHYYRLVREAGRRDDEDTYTQVQIPLEGVPVE